MSARFFENTIWPYLTAVERGLATPPQLGSAWYVPDHDSHIQPGWLAATMLKRFLSGSDSPWALAYVLSFGNNEEKLRAKQIFYEWFRISGSEDDFGEWLGLVRFFVVDDPALLSLFNYRRGDMWPLLSGSSGKGYWEDCVCAGVPSAIADLRQEAQSMSSGLSANEGKIADMCTALLPLGRNAYTVVGREAMESLAHAAFESWKSLRHEVPEEGLVPAILSWDRLKWCWRFGWHDILAGLCNEKQFLDDCIYPYRNSSIFFLMAGEVAENILLLSSSPQCRFFDDSFFEIDLFAQHLELAKKYISGNFQGEHPEVMSALESLALGDVFPMDGMRWEDKVEQLLHGNRELDRTLSLTAHACCVDLWKLRLSISIMMRRTGVTPRLEERKD